MATARNLTLDGRAIFSFPDQWSSGQWRSVPDGPTAFPGAEPYCYAAITVLALGALVLFVSFVSLPLDKHPLSDLKRKVIALKAKVKARWALRFGEATTLLRMADKIFKTLPSADRTEDLYFRLARAMAYQGLADAALKIYPAGAAWGYFLADKLQEAIQVTSAGSGPAGIVRLMQVKEIDKQCQQASDYKAALDEMIRCGHKVVFGDLAETAFGFSPRRA